MIACVISMEFPLWGLQVVKVAKAVVLNYKKKGAGRKKKDMKGTETLSQGVEAWETFIRSAA